MLQKLGHQELWQPVPRNGNFEKTLANSINTVSAKLMDKVGQAVVKHIN
jgi:hypothetical protein